METIIIFQELNIGCIDFVVSLVMSPLYLYHTLMSWRLISHASWKVTLQNTFGASVGLDVSKSVIMMTTPERVLRINYDNLWNSWIDAMTTCMIRRQLSLQVQRQNKKSRQSKFQLTTKKKWSCKMKENIVNSWQSKFYNSRQNTTNSQQNKINLR